MSDWQTQAACRGLPTNLFFPKRGDNTMINAAKQVCALCPVKTECLQQAQTDPEIVGIWGGTTYIQRRRTRHHQRVDNEGHIPGRIAHGTSGGYHVHRRRGEKPCPRCRAAFNAMRRGTPALIPPPAA